jgi:hypothetical protein
LQATLKHRLQAGAYNMPMAYCRAGFPNPAFPVGAQLAAPSEGRTKVRPYPGHRRHFAIPTHAPSGGPASLRAGLVAIVGTARRDAGPPAIP